MNKNKPEPAIGMNQNGRGPRITARLVGAVALAALLAACADMQGIEPQSTPRDAASLGLAGTAAMPGATQASLPRMDSQWWKAFGDSQLDALVERALRDNPNLQVARARLQKAQSQTDVARAGGKPTLNGQLDLTRQQFSANSIYPSPLGGSIRNLGTLQLNGGWELDLFGRNRTQVEASIGAANAAAADADAARIMLAGNVAQAYVQWARLNGQIEVGRRTLSQRDETLRLVRDRVNAGLDTSLELRQSEGGLPTTRAQLEALAEQVTLARHALEALVGQPGATEGLAPPVLANLHPMPMGTQIPADLLGRRADIAAARFRIEAASSDVANARTQFYPNINLVAFAGTSSIGFGNLLKSGSEQWGVGPALRLPIFEGGRLRANLRGKAADLDAAIETYNANVIDAVRDVSDQVASAQSIERQIREQRDAQTAAESAYEISTQRYGAGLGNFLNVLTAETSVLAARREAIDLSARVLETQIALARALGGGWQGPDLAAAGGATPTAQAAPVLPQPAPTTTPIAPATAAPRS